jgi:hypothetical protein
MLNYNVFMLRAGLVSFLLLEGETCGEQAFYVQNGIELLSFDHELGLSDQ